MQKGTFYMHISVVPVFMTPYQLGINWSSFMEGERNYLDVLAFCYGLHWDQLQGPDNDWTKGGTVLFWLGQALLENTALNILKHTWFSVTTRGRDPREKTQTRRKEENVNRDGCGQWMQNMFFCCRQTTLKACWSLSSDSLTLEPQLAVLIRLHCLKSTFFCLNRKSYPH